MCRPYHIHLDRRAKNTCALVHGDAHTRTHSKKQSEALCAAVSTLGKCRQPGFSHSFPVLSVFPLLPCLPYIPSLCVVLFRPRPPSSRMRSQRAESKQEETTGLLYPPRNANVLSSAVHQPGLKISALSSG